MSQEIKPVELMTLDQLISAVKEITEEVNPVEKVKRTKTFKEYYSDEEFKKKHLAHMLEKVECSACKRMVSRGNISTHKKSRMHVRMMELHPILADEEKIEKIVESYLLKNNMIVCGKAI